MLGHASPARPGAADTAGRERGLLSPLQGLPGFPVLPERSHQRSRQTADRSQKENDELPPRPRACLDPLAPLLRRLLLAPSLFTGQDEFALVGSHILPALGPLVGVLERLAP